MLSEVAMFLRRLLRERLHVPSRIALLLGFGALSTGAQANAPETDVANPPIAASEREYIRSGEVLIRSDGTRIYVSEDGEDFRQLGVANTPEARLLKELIERHNKESGSQT